MKHCSVAFIFVVLLCGLAFAQESPTPAPTPSPTPEENVPQTADDFFTLGVQRFRTGDLAGAERQARTAIALNSHHIEGHYLLGQILLYRAAQKNRLLIDNPGLGSAILPSDNQWEQGIPELQEAISQFRVVIRLKPNHTSAWLLLATCLDNSGQEEEAINAYKQTINLDPISPTARDAWNNLGLLHLSQKRFREAKFAYESALRIDPTFTPARINLEKLKKIKPRLFR